jgi:hypothetical protein
MLVALEVLLLGGLCSLHECSTPKPQDAAQLATSAPQSRRRLWELGTVSGRVVDDSTKQPIERFEVRLRYLRGWKGSTIPSNRRSRSSSSSGDFTLTGVKLGEYVVEGSAAGYAPSYSVPFYVAEGQEITSVEVRMTEGGTLTGRVLDPQGAPVGHARVRAEDDTYVEVYPPHARAIVCGWSTDATSSEGRTDSSGRFALHYLHPATYKLIVSADGYADNTIQTIEVRDGRVEDLGVLVLDRGATLRGTLRDVSGAPIVAGVVELETAGTVSGLHSHHRPVTAADGTFSIGAISPGRYRALTSRSAADDASFVSFLTRWDDASFLGQQLELCADELVTRDLVVRD